MQTERRHPHRYEIENQARCLTCSCNQRLPLFNNDRIKDAFVDQLARVHDQYDFALLAWVLMPEHFHLLVIPTLPECPVPRVLVALKMPFAKFVIGRWRELQAAVLPRITDRSGRARFWLKGGGYDRNMRSEGDLIEKITYIHMNPVRRGLVKTPEEWRWSSACWYAGERNEKSVPIDPPRVRRRQKGTW